MSDPLALAESYVKHAKTDCRKYGASREVEADIDAALAALRRARERADAEIVALRRVAEAANDYIEHLDGWHSPESEKAHRLNINAALAAWREARK